MREDLPQTAENDGNEIDATTCSDQIWSAIHCCTPPVKVKCRECGQPMTAKNSKLGNRFFSHVVERPECPSYGETREHREMKRLLASAIRAQGWEAHLEATPMSGDVGVWRADVLAVDPSSGRRVAFEVQLAGMTVATGKLRTDRYSRDGIDTYWVAHKNAWWLWRLPGFRIEHNHSERSPIVTRGVAYFGPHRDVQGAVKAPEFMYWQPPSKDLTLDQLMKAVVEGTLTVHEIDPDDGRRLAGGRTMRGSGERMSLLVSRGSLERASNYQGSTDDVNALVEKPARDQHEEPDPDSAMTTFLEEIPDRRASLVKLLSDGVRAGSYFRGYYQRQARLIPVVLAEVESRCAKGEQVWIGIPPRRIGVSGPISSFRREDDLGWCELNGNLSTSDGALFSVGPDSTHAVPVAIVSPIPMQHRPGASSFWREWGVTLYVETADEEATLALIAGYKPGEIVVVGES
jgi:hypothetical protein